MLEASLKGNKKYERKLFIVIKYDNRYKKYEYNDCVCCPFQR